MPDPEETDYTYEEMFGFEQLDAETDGVVTLRERVRSRLGALIDEHAWLHLDQKEALVSAIMREFALRPVAAGTVDAETEEVKLG